MCGVIGFYSIVSWMGSLRCICETLTSNTMARYYIENTLPPTLSALIPRTRSLTMSFGLRVEVSSKLSYSYYVLIISYIPVNIYPLAWALRTYIHVVATRCRLSNWFKLNIYDGPIIYKRFLFVHWLIAIIIYGVEY